MTSSAERWETNTPEHSVFAAYAVPIGARRDNRYPPYASAATNSVHTTKIAMPVLRRMWRLKSAGCKTVATRRRAARRRRVSTRQLAPDRAAFNEGRPE